MNTRASFLVALLCATAVAVSPVHGMTEQAPLTMEAIPEDQDHGFPMPRKLQIIQGFVDSIIGSIDPTLLSVGILLALVVALTIGTVVVSLSVA